MTPTPLKSTVKGISLSDVLNQPASRKRTLESADIPTTSTEGPALKKQASDPSIGKSQSTSNTPSFPKIKIPKHPNSGVSKAPSPDKNDKLSKVMKLHLSTSELRMQMTAAKKSNSQTPSSEPSTQKGVQSPQTQATKGNQSTQNTSTLTVPSTSSINRAVSPSSTLKLGVPPASTVKTTTTAKRTGFPSGINKSRSSSASSLSSPKTSSPTATKVVSTQPSPSVTAAPREPKTTVPQSSSGTAQPSLQNSQTSAIKSQSNASVAKKQTPAPVGTTTVPPTQPPQTKSGVNGVQPATGAGPKTTAGQTTQNSSKNTPIPTSTVSKETTQSATTKPPAVTTSGTSTISKTAHTTPNAVRNPSTNIGQSTTTKPPAVTTSGTSTISKTAHTTPNAVRNPSTNVGQSTPVNGFRTSVDKEQPKLPATSNKSKALAEQNLPAATPKPSNETGNGPAIKDPLQPTINGTATNQPEPSPSHHKDPAISAAQTSQSKEQPTGPCTSPKTGQKIRIRLSSESSPKKDFEVTRPPTTSTSSQIGVATSNIHATQPAAPSTLLLEASIPTGNNNSNNTTPTTPRQTGTSNTSPALSALSSASSQFETDGNFCNDGSANMFTSISSYF